MRIYDSPRFPRPGLQLKGKDVFSLVSQGQNVGVSKQIAPPINRIAIVGGSEAHPVICGLRKLAKTFPFNLKLDLTTTAASTYVDADISDVSTTGGNLLVDLNQFPDKQLAIYIGSMKDGDQRREMYAVLRMCVPVLIRTSGTVSANRWQYTGEVLRLTENPADTADGQEAHPDALPITLFNASEFGNTSTAAYDGEVEFDSNFLGIFPIRDGATVLACPMSFPKSADSAGGDVWIFDRLNRANMACPDNLNTLFTPF